VKEATRRDIPTIAGGRDRRTMLDMSFKDSLVAITLLRGKILRKHAQRMAERKADRGDASPGPSLQDIAQLEQSAEFVEEFRDQVKQDLPLMYYRLHVEREMFMVDAIRYRSHGKKVLVITHPLTMPGIKQWWKKSKHHFIQTFHPVFNYV
jgi:hypothetical protein